MQYEDNYAIELDKEMELQQDWQKKYDEEFDKFLVEQFERKEMGRC